MRLAPDVTITTQSVPTAWGAAGVYHTLAVMRRMVDRFKSHPDVLQAATGIVYLAPEHNGIGEVLALYEYVRDSVRYVRDPVGLEAVADPATTLRRMTGDCDDQATLLATLFEAVGYPTRFVIAGYQARDYEHVYLQVFVENQWIAADPIYKQFWLGWEAPGALVYSVEKV